MNIEMERYESEWVGVSVALSCQEIDKFMDRLGELKNGLIGHFHIRTNSFDGIPSISDIEFSITDVFDDRHTVE